MFRFQPGEHLGSQPSLEVTASSLKVERQKKTTPIYLVFSGYCGIILALSSW